MKWLIRYLVGITILLLDAGIFAQTALKTITQEEFSQRLQVAFATLEDRNYQGIVGIAFKDYEPIYQKFGRLLEIDTAAGDIQVDLLSITKTITAVMVLKLVESGKVELDSRLSSLFDGVPSDKADITVHQLLTHSAGFREAIGSDEKIIGRNDYLEEAWESRLRFEPSTSYGYSNTGYSILAAIIETITNKSYEDYLQQDVLGEESRIRLGYTSIYESDRSLRTRRGRGIAEASWGNERAYWNLIGNGGLVATVRDMIEFRKRITTGQILSPELFELIQTPHVQEVPDNTYYGYGMVVESQSRNGTFYWHNGANNAFSSMWIDFTDQGVSIFAASTGSFDADSAARIVADHIFHNLLEK